MILNIAQVTPAGMLVFFPSYALLNKLTTRWMASGTYAALKAIKPVFAEPRGANSGEAFDENMQAYYAQIRAHPAQGALFMAVFRGKASEGLDFADARARCVVLVGIPYPNVMDAKVQLKKEYNNLMGGALLNGSAWYDQQAYRALNQVGGGVVCVYCFLLFLGCTFGVVSHNIPPPYPAGGGPVYTASERLGSNHVFGWALYQCTEPEGD